MRFAYPWWLLGIGLGLVVALFLVLGGMKLLRSLRDFGDESAVQSLVTHRVGKRRVLKGSLLVLAVALAFVALAGPQYGRGTRLLPATNLDVVIVLDYSKSMYARDVAPSRSERAKIEVARLIHELTGARFGAVAFAGQPLSFPLTSDGAAIAQFFRQLSPNDMPVGGTAIARALESARGLFDRDPLSARHQKVVLLVTDGEDLEGDPVAIAKSAASSGIVVHVVQIGGRTPEPIPNVDDDGNASGIRMDSEGKPLTTSLTADGEAQLAEIAKAGNGNVVRAAEGETGIDIVTRAMKQMMTEELSEKVETVYADVFWYPLGLCLLLLLVDLMLSETPRAKKRPEPDSAVPTSTKREDTELSPPKATRVAVIGVIVSLSLLLGGCQQIEKTLFSRHSPDVDKAIGLLEKNDAGAASGVLETYLSTGACSKGDIGTPENLRTKPQASLDLGLALFEIGERFGARFGEEKPASPKGAKDPAETEQLARRSQEVDCALRIVRIIAADPDLDPALRASAYYLSGNLEFLRHDYQKAVDSYDSCLKLVPGEHADSGISVGRDAAYNRAIALRRIEEQKKDEPDAGPPPQSDGGSPKDDQKQDDQKDQDDKKQDQKDQKQDDQKPGDQDQKQDQKDQKQDDQKPGDQDQENDQKQGGDEEAKDDAQKQPAPEPSASAEPSSPSLSQDQRILDGLEEAPTLQQEAARKQRGRVVRGMEDK
jgi:Ca-activated chloride channel family protein